MSLRFRKMRMADTAAVWSGPRTRRNRAIACRAVVVRSWQSSRRATIIVQSRLPAPQAIGDALGGWSVEGIAVHSI